MGKLTSIQWILVDVFFLIIIFHILGIYYNPNWLIFFSEGLKPPTRIGLRENLQESLIFNVKIDGFRCRFPLNKSIDRCGKLTSYSHFPREKRGVSTSMLVYSRVSIGWTLFTEHGTVHHQVRTVSMLSLLKQINRMVMLPCLNLVENINMWFKHV